MRTCYNSKILQHGQVFQLDLRTLFNHQYIMGNYFVYGSRIELERVEANILGRGSFGVVYRGKLDGKDVAVKAINRHFNQRYWDKLQNETVTLKKSLRHRNIIDILMYEDKSPAMPEVWIVMELCDDNLYCYIEKESLGNSEILDILLQCAGGLKFLHDNNLVHRDIKPDNFLLKRSAYTIRGSKSSVTMKVTDFSLMKDIDGFTESEITSIHGNTHWLAPELFNDQGRRAKNIRFRGPTLQKIDVFSFSLIILFTCLTAAGRKNLCENYDIGLDVKQGKNIFQLFKNQWKNEFLEHMLTPLLCKMMNVDPLARPTMTEVKRYLHKKLEMPVNLEHITSHVLGFEPLVYVGISESNYVFLQSTDNIYLYELQEGNYFQEWVKPMPKGLRFENRMYATNQHLITCQIGSVAPALCWDLDLQYLHSHKIRTNDKEGLIGALSHHNLVLRKYDEDEYKLCVYDGEYLLMTLHAPTGIEWGWKLSVCQHPTRGWIAVSEEDSGTLTVYSKEGNYLHHAELNFRVGFRSAITCTDDCLIMREATTCRLHCYKWSGEKVNSLNVRRQLKCKTGDEECIWSLGFSGHHTLNLAVGPTDGSRVTSLHALLIM